MSQPQRKDIRGAGGSMQRPPEETARKLWEPKCERAESLLPACFVRFLAQGGPLRVGQSWKLEVVGVRSFEGRSGTSQGMEVRVYKVCHRLAQRVYNNKHIPHVFIKHLLCARQFESQG